MLVRAWCQCSEVRDTAKALKAEERENLLLNVWFVWFVYTHIFITAVK